MYLPTYNFFSYRFKLNSAIDKKRHRLILDSIYNEHTPETQTYMARMILYMIINDGFR